MAMFKVLLLGCAHTGKTVILERLTRIHNVATEERINRHSAHIFCFIDKRNSPQSPLLYRDAAIESSLEKCGNFL